MKLKIHSGISSRHALVSALALTLMILLPVPAWAAQAPERGSKQAVVTVQGMQCPFCAYGIRKHLAKLPGARKVEVELAKNQAIVTFAPDAKVGDKEIQQAVRNAGFTAGKIEWRSAGQKEER
jgi:mercuric ion binding protein